jgi:thioredoxin 1
MIEIAGRDFETEVLGCSVPVFACFTTKWCHPCFATCLVADQLTREYDGVVKFVRLDMEESPDIAERYHVIAVPTILLFQNSRLAKRLLGFQERSSLRALLSNATSEISSGVKRPSSERNRAYL